MSESVTVSYTTYIGSKSIFYTPQSVKKRRSPRFSRFDGAAMGLDSLEHLESVDLDKPDPSLGVRGGAVEWASWPCEVVSTA